MHRITILLLGEPNPAQFQELTELPSTGLILDNGDGRDPVFSLYENLSRADLIIAFPNANLLHLVSLIAEAEVGHPLLFNGKQMKPIIFSGNKESWNNFHKYFSEMRRHGLLREGFDRHVKYVDASMSDIFSLVSSEIPSHLPSTRLHYYKHSTKNSDLIVESRVSKKRTGSHTVSFFGSASCSDEKVLTRAKKAAQICSAMKWNILHGGGDAGVMGQLSESGKKGDTLVIGISVDISGAPKIYFERDKHTDMLLDLDHYVASKDMLHRIESYALYSDAFVALDGGIGSVQEILVISSLLESHHPSVVTKQGELKPLILYNESGIYDELLSALPDDSILQDAISVVTSIEELQETLKTTLESRSSETAYRLSQRDLRSLYDTIEAPQMPIVY